MPARIAHRYGGWIAFAAGLLLPFAFAPFDVWPLAPLVLALLFALWDQATPRRAARIGFAFGFGLFLFGTHWLYVSLHVYGKAPLALALPLMAALMALMAAYTAGLAFLVVRVWPRPGPLRWLLVLPAGWVLAEWLRGWVLSGFPWLSVGYSATNSPLAGLLPVGGVYAASYAVLLSAGALRMLAIAPRRLWPVAAAVLCCVWIGAATLRVVEWTEPQPETLRISIVQGAIPQDRKWLPEELIPTMRLYRDLSAQHWDSDIVIWPEAAIPALRASLTTYLADLHRDARRAGAGVVMGIIEHEPETGRFYNGILALDEDVAVYHKRHLVPFGEYFPVPGFVREWLRLRNLPYSDYTPGDAAQPALPVAGQRLGTSICYEDVFGDELRAMLPTATLLVNVSNDAWFGASIAPHQHLQIARARAIEAGRYLLRATNTGISAIIAPDGAVEQTAPQFQTAVLNATVRPYRGATPYVRVGDKAVIALALAALAAAAVAARRAGGADPATG